MSHATEVPVVFNCGGHRLLGILHHAPQANAKLGVLIVVGGPQYRVGSHRQFVHLARGLASAGFPVMRFDHRGIGDSEGTPRTFEQINEDIRAAVDAFFQGWAALERTVLWGLCDGASAILLGPSADRRVSGLVLANPWVRSESRQARAYVRHYYPRRLLQGSFWSKLLSGEVRVASALSGLFRTMLAARQKSGRGDDRLSSGDYVDAMRTGLAAFGGPVLVLESERDLTAREFADLCETDPQWRLVMAGHNVSRELCHGSDHTFSGPEAREQARRHTVNWLRLMSIAT